MNAPGTQPRVAAGRCGTVMKVSDLQQQSSSHALLAEQCVATLPETGLVICCGPYDELLQQFGVAWGSLLCPDTAMSDVRVVKPAGASWTVAEVNTHIIDPVGMVPYKQHVVVIARAATLPFDRVLKTFEEPPCATLWLLCTDNVDQLSPTIRSRALSVIDVVATPDAGVLETVAAVGADPEATQTFFGPVLDLLPQMCNDALAPALNALRDAADNASVSTAAHAMGKVRTLCTTSKLDGAATRRVNRCVTNQLIAAFQHTLTAALLDGADPEAVLAAGNVFEASRLAVVTYARVDVHVINAALAVQRATR